MFIDDTAVIKKWVTLEIEKVKEGLVEEFRPKIEKHKNELGKIWSQNLLVPDIIGPEGTGCNHESLSAYIKYNESQRGVVSEEMKENMEIVCKTESKKVVK